MTQLTQAHIQQEMNESARGSRIVATAVFLGIFLSIVATFTLLGMSSLGLIGIWVLSMGMAWIAVALLSQRIYKQAQWGMVVAGQAMGAIAIVIFLFAVL